MKRSYALAILLLMFVWTGEGASHLLTENANISRLWSSAVILIAIGPGFLMILRAIDEFYQPQVDGDSQLENVVRN